MPVRISTTASGYRFPSDPDWSRKQVHVLKQTYVGGHPAAVQLDSKSRLLEHFSQRRRRRILILFEMASRDHLFAKLSMPNQEHLNACHRVISRYENACRKVLNSFSH